MIHESNTIESPGISKIYCEKKCIMNKTTGTHAPLLIISNFSVPLKLFTTMIDRTYNRMIYIDALLNLNLKLKKTNLLRR